MSTILNHKTAIINHIKSNPETVASMLPLIENILANEGWDWNDIVELLSEIMEHFKSECGESVISETIYSYIYYPTEECGYTDPVAVPNN